MSVLDACRSYHQIMIHEPDQEKIAFITPRSMFYYKVMPIELKNARVTYQMMITKMFEPIMGKNMDA